MAPEANAAATRALSPAYDSPCPDRRGRCRECPHCRQRTERLVGVTGRGGGATYAAVSRRRACGRPFLLALVLEGVGGLPACRTRLIRARVLRRLDGRHRTGQELA